MGVDAPRKRKNDDGSVTLWFRGRQFDFPEGGGEPYVTEAEPPDDAEESQGLKWGESEFKYGRWLVRFDDEGEPRVVHLPKRTTNGGVIRLFKRELPE